MTKEEIAQGVQQALDQYAQYDSNGQPVTAERGKKILNVELSTGTAVIGTVAISQATPGTSNGVQVNAALPAGSNTIGNTIPALTTGTTGAPSQFRSLTVNSTAQAVKASTGNVYGWNINNEHVATIYVKIYNIAAASVNPASDVPVRTIKVPAGGVAGVENNGAIQNNCSTAISVRCVTGSADNDTTAPATLPIIEILYL